MEDGTGLWRRIDGYCERMSPDFWAEPVNALTNTAFLISSIVCFLIARREGRLDGPVIYLSGLVFVIGIGSFLFHTFATVWAAMMDTGPILLFILSFFTIAMNRFVGCGWIKSVLLTVGFLVAMFGMSAVLRWTIGPYIGGSQSYFPAMIALLVVGFWLRLRGHPAGNWLIGVAFLFAVSLTFRTMDRPVCGSFPLGTHFMWHMLNACVLGTLIVAVIRHGRLPAVQEP